MPELPEVETIRRTLEPKLTGRTIVTAKIAYPPMVQGQTTEELIRAITGRNIRQVHRRGKYLLLVLSDALVLALHLRMTGQLTVVSENAPLEKATYFQVTLDNGTQLRFRDQRKFGKIFTFAQGKLPQSLAKLGPEPLEPEFTVDILQERLARHQLAVKKALLNQEIIAGIGNIYADEALFRAGIHPARPVGSLNESELTALYRAIREVLTAAIELRGTTKRDYRDGEGHPGSFQDQLQVYGRKGEKCTVCGGMIVRMNFGGRGTSFCPFCQK